MNDKIYQTLVVVAISMTLLWVGWTLYDSYFYNLEPGDTYAYTADNDFADGQYAKALASYEAALREAPEHLHALRGKARSMLMLKRYPEALSAFNQAIAKAPDFPGTYANRGILHDHMEHYEEAIADYEKALQMDASLSEGPGWFTRFFRLQPEKPPTIADRMNYLKQELAKSPAERLLKNPQADAGQRPYKL